MDYFLGIDGGGTRTVAWLADGEGQVVARSEGGPSNPLKVGFPAAEREILRVSRACWQDAGISPRVVRAAHPRFLQSVCAGIAGVDRPSVHRPLLSWMRQHIPARRYLLTSDAAIALAAAVRDAHGIVVIVGTGSIAFARDEQGKVLRAGGWGIPFDDRGSGYDVGRKAVAAALEAFDGRGTATILMEMICRHLSLRDISEIISRKLEPRQIASLCPLVIEAAGQRDPVARQLCDAAARELANLAVALLKRARWMDCPTPVVTTGGVFQANNLIRRGFARHVRRFAPAAQVEMLQRPPVEGALWLARRLGHTNPGETTRRRK